MAGTTVRGYTKKDVMSVEQPVRTGSRINSSQLDASTTSQIIELGDVFSKITFQASGDLAGTIEFSMNGVNFVTSTALPASNAMASYNTHNVASVRITRSGGSGKVALGCK